MPKRLHEHQKISFEFVISCEIMEVNQHFGRGTNLLKFKMIKTFYFQMSK